MIPDRNDFAKASTSPTGSGFVKEQLEILGVPVKGSGRWILRLIGTEISDELWDRFVKAGDKKRKKNYSKVGRKVEDGPVFIFNGSSNKAHCKDHGLKPDLSVHECFNFVNKSDRSEFYSSPEWLHLRAVALRLGRYKCAHCGAMSRNGVTLHVDHIEPLSVNWERRLDLLNLQVLCQQCNIGKSNIFTG